MTPHKAEVGERYGDDSGWEKRVQIDLLNGKLDIEMGGQIINAHPRDIHWIIEALETVRRAVGLED